MSGTLWMYADSSNSGFVTLNQITSVKDENERWWKAYGMGKEHVIRGSTIQVRTHIPTGTLFC